jgi:NAD(P)-dependent dehydrogenase (short-subunit alcohol dehydrogenase family)
MGGPDFFDRLIPSSVSGIRMGEAMVGMLEGKSALVTGGGGGIGRAAAFAFAREGANVAVADLVAEAAGETVAMLNRAGGQAMWLTGDITNDGLVRDMIGSVVAAYGRLDCASIICPLQTATESLLRGQAGMLDNMGQSAGEIQMIIRLFGNLFLLQTRSKPLRQRTHQEAPGVNYFPKPTASSGQAY